MSVDTNQTTVPTSEKKPRKTRSDKGVKRGPRKPKVEEGAA